MRYNTLVQVQGLKRIKRTKLEYTMTLRTATAAFVYEHISIDKIPIYLDNDKNNVYNKKVVINFCFLNLSKRLKVLVYFRKHLYILISLIA